jgi:hypothetical protein
MHGNDLFIGMKQILRHRKVMWSVNELYIARFLAEVAMLRHII